MFDQCFSNGVVEPPATVGTVWTMARIGCCIMLHNPFSSTPFDAFDANSDVHSNNQT